MSFFGLWMVAPLPDEEIARLAAVLMPVIEHQAALPHIRARWQRWATAPEQVRGHRQGLDPDHPQLLILDTSSTAFLELSSACPLNEEEPYNLVNEVWHLVDPDASLVVTCRKGFPAAALAHALGPERFARLPGWFGDFVLDAAQTRAVLPHIREALALDADEHRQALARAVDWLCEVGDGDAEDATPLLDGLVPVWQAAVDAGAGLFGHMVIPG